MSAQGFTYCWSDHLHAKVYVGVHLGDLDDGYVCSSKSMLAEYKARPQDYTREILFSGPFAMCAQFEKSLIAGLFKQSKDTFYNRSNGLKILFDDAIRDKIRQKALGRKMPKGQREKMMAGMAGRPGPRTGVVLSAETRQKISDAKKGCAGPNLGRKMSEETKAKMSLSQKLRAPFPAEHRAKLAAANARIRLAKSKEMDML